MSTIGFAVSPASLQGPLCNPRKGCDWGWCPAASQRDGAKDLVRCKKNLEDLAKMHIAVSNCKSFARDEKPQGTGQL